MRVLKFGGSSLATPDRIHTVARIVLRPRRPFAHAARYHLANGQTLVGCYHPSRQNTNTGKLTAPMMDDVFKVVRRILKSG